MEFSPNLAIIFGLSWVLVGAIGGAVIGYVLGWLVAVRQQNQTKNQTKNQTLRPREAPALICQQPSFNVTNHSEPGKDPDDSCEPATYAEWASGSADLFDSFNSLDLSQRLSPESSSRFHRLVERVRAMEQELAESKDQLARQSQELSLARREARTDPLCQIGNRKGAEERLESLLAKYLISGVGFGLMLIDVDQLKQLNDRFGHQTGDRVLSEISRLLVLSIRSEDSVFRLGGDEFMVLLSPLKRENLEGVGSRIQQTVEGGNFFPASPDQSRDVTLSIGMTMVTEGDTAESLFQRADRALYQAKQLGRNRLSIAEG